MGAPSKLRSRISKPSHPWQGERIKEEKDLIREYGLKNKREVWRMQSSLRGFFTQTKSIIATRTEQSEKEKLQLLKKLRRLGIIDESTNLEDILGLSMRDIAERRLQSLLVRKGLSRSMRQARQFISHGHVMVNGKKITSPGFIVPKDEENTIMFANNSNFSDEMHPERTIKEQMPQKPEEVKEELKENKGKKKEEKADKKAGKKEKAEKAKEEKAEKDTQEKSEEKKEKNPEEKPAEEKAEKAKEEKAEKDTQEKSEEKSEKGKEE